MEVLIELSEDCYCNLSVPIPNEQTLVGYRSYFDVEFCFQFKIPKTVKIMWEWLFSVIRIYRYQSVHKDCVFD